MTTIKAIETHYKGYRFRSRLEARWAVYFDALGIAWEYEKEGYDLGEVGRYLPDFWLPQVKKWAEVKPEMHSWNEIEKCILLAEMTGFEVVLLDGMPDFRSYFVCGLDEIYKLANPATGEIASISDGGYPGGDYSVPVPWNDVIINADYLDESRFFMATGDAVWPSPFRFNEQDRSYIDTVAAVRAARSARFEHGENG